MKVVCRLYLLSTLAHALVQSHHAAQTHAALYVLDPSITCAPFNVLFTNFEINLRENKHSF